MRDPLGGSPGLKGASPWVLTPATGTKRPELQLEHDWSPTRRRWHGDHCHIPEASVPQVRLALPDMPPSLWQPEAIAVKVQAIGHAVGHTVGGHLAILNFWRGWLERNSNNLGGSPHFSSAALQLPSGDLTAGRQGYPSQGRSTPRKQVLTGRPAST